MWSRSNALAHAVALIKEFEGCHLEAYPDPGTGGDPWTIGWGSTGPGIRKGVKWTQEQADKRLAADVDRFLEGVIGAVNAEASHPEPNEIGAMTSLAYNIGLMAFAGSTLLMKFNKGNTEGASLQFPNWNRSGGRAMKGLTNRRKDEQRVFDGAA